MTLSLHAGDKPKLLAQIRVLDNEHFQTPSRNSQATDERWRTLSKFLVICMAFRGIEHAGSGKVKLVNKTTLLANTNAMKYDKRMGIITRN